LLNAAGRNDLRPFNLEREFCGISQGVVIQRASFPIPPRPFYPSPSTPFPVAVAGIKDEMKPKYHALPLPFATAPSPPSATGHISALPPYRLRRNLERREFYHSLSLSFPVFLFLPLSHASPIAERACCLPVKRQRIHPLLNQYCANLSAARLSERPPSGPLSFSHHGSSCPVPFSSRFCHLRSLDMPSAESIVYSTPSLPLVIDLCANIEPRRRGRE